MPVAGKLFSAQYQAARWLAHRARSFRMLDVRDQAVLSRAGHPNLSRAARKKIVPRFLYFLFLFSSYFRSAVPGLITFNSYPPIRLTSI